MLPVWYKTAKPLIDSGKLAMLGVVQEQHAERAQLYKQWKQFDFPIAQDATTRLNLAVVPVPVLIDEHGVVRNTRPRPADLAKFAEAKFEAVKSEQQPESTDQPMVSIREGIHVLAGYLVQDSRYPETEPAIAAFENATRLDPENAKALFSLGVAYRMRFDSSEAREGDFEKASKLWSRALAINPNQYIWRRRIQQYGPKLGKPYPFYDWVDDAIADIKKRGEIPIKLTVDLTGSELAGRSKTFTASENDKNPDPESKIIQSEAGIVQLTSSTVPATVKRGSVVRVHLNLKAINGKWNHEAGPLSVWINETSNGKPEKRLLEFVRDPVMSPSDQRNIDFEFQTDKGSENPVVEGYVLFHICDDEGVCFYYRKNFKVPITTNAG